MSNDCAAESYKQLDYKKDTLSNRSPERNSYQDLFQRFGPRPPIKTGVYGGPSDGVWSVPYQYVDDSDPTPQFIVQSRMSQPITDASKTYSFGTPDSKEPIPEKLIITVDECVRLGSEGRIIAISTELTRDASRVVLLFVVPAAIDPSEVSAGRSKFKKNKNGQKNINLVSKSGKQLGETERRYVLGPDIDELAGYFTSLTK